MFIVQLFFLVWEHELNLFSKFPLEPTRLINPLKHKKFSPGFHIPVYSSEKIKHDQPDVIIILAWQHKDSILIKYNNTIFKDKIIILPL